MKRVGIVFCMVILAAIHNIHGQLPGFQFRHLTVNDGLSHNQITSLYKDRKGFLWIGTFAGLNRFDGYTTKIFTNDSEDPASIRSNSILGIFELPDGKIAVQTTAGFSVYDPKTETFDNALSHLNDKYGIPDNQLTEIVKDQKDNYWFILQSQGLIFHSTASGTNSKIKHDHNDSQSVSSDSITSLAVDDQNKYWIMHANGLLEQITAEGKVLYRNDFLRKRNASFAHRYRIKIDSENNLWVYLSDDPQGVYYFKTSERSFTHFHERSSPIRLNSNIVAGVAESAPGLIWIGTDHGGINVMDLKSKTVQYVTNKPEDERSIGQNSITAVFQDNEGIIWFGTFKRGLSYYHQNLIRFSLYRQFSLSKTGLPFGDVNRFIEDGKGNLWIGTNGGGLIYFDRTNDTFTQYLHDPSDPFSIGSNVVVSLCIDHEQKLWVGTYFGGLCRLDGKRFIRYTHDAKNPESISDQNVWEIFEDSRNRLWIGTMHGGLDLLDRKTNRFSHYRLDDLNSVKSNYIAAIAEDGDGNIWIGTGAGIDVLEQESGRFFHYGAAANAEGSISDNFIFDIRTDYKDRVWIATRNGLNIFDKKSKTFKSFREKQGLPHNTILNILEDSKHNLWLSTPNGLSRATIADEEGAINLTFRNYDEADGLQGKQFNENAACKTSRGELIFGGANGFNIFIPEKLGENKTPPQVVFSDFHLYNRSIAPGESVDGDVILTESISEVSGIVLPANQNVFSIEFAALSYFNPEKNQYQYKMKGFHQEWLTTDGNERRASFTNLDPGEYTFQVKAANNDGHWNNEGASIKITVLPPIWKTQAAFVIYCLVIVGALLVTRKLIQKRERLKFEREQERNEAIRMHELDMMKIKFFTNVSHEFRTPLTLILTPLEKLLRQSKDADQAQQFQLIQRNAKRLLNLVNQLLDFRKLEVQEVKLSQSEGDIIKFIKDAVYSFSDLSEKKNIQLDFFSNVDSLETLFDQDKFEKILFNLLSNAFKFTPERGSVLVNVSVENRDHQKFLKVLVKDTGIGIPEDKLEKIFERFFQNELPKSFMNQGSGIGLSITKEFVKLHGGSIRAESKVGEGSSFILEIPIVEVLQHHHDTVDSEPVTVVESADPTVSNLPVLLLVEDNEDFRFYLKDNLKSNYKILEARNGVEGLKISTEAHPDLIVSDIMMPEMNGIDLCRKIKSDARTSHIPVILLTARSAEEQKLEGFETGADDYLTKPFNFEILVSRIRNLISQREKLHKAFGGQVAIKTSELNITSLDEQLIEKAIKVVEQNIADPDFSVEMLSHELGISRAHFYKKIMALTGRAPLEFIRTIRLQQAAQMLEKSQLTVAEIAYKVGFNNPKYFARYFKDQYKMLPSVYASEKRK